MDRRPNDDTHRERRVWLGDLNPFKEYIESGQLNRLLKGMYGFLSISLSSLLATVESRGVRPWWS
jgi:hypothetical protein